MLFKPAWLEDEALQFILLELSLYGSEAYAVGGCVRDAVIGRHCADIDIATARTPEQVRSILSGFPGVELRPTGVEHGTWTVVVDGRPFEVTSFRKDVATDGRRAVVEYSTFVKDDAQRRDFTMNALYMDWKGNLVDPTGLGLKDILARRIRFVGDAEERCREDYLRIMRLFRFHAHVGVGPMDVDALAAAKACAEGLNTISGERKWSELKKLLSAPDPVSALVAMESTGVLGLVMPNHGAIEDVAEVVIAEQRGGLQPKWERRFAALLYQSNEIMAPASNAERRHIRALVEYKYHGAAPSRVAFLTKDRDVAFDSYVLACADGHAPFRDPTEEIELGMKIECPVTAAHLMELGVPQGADLGLILQFAHTRFVRSGFKMSREALLAEMRHDLLGKYL